MPSEAPLPGSLTLTGPYRIERLQGVTDGAKVPIENGSEARWAIDSSGRQWVRKCEEDTGFQPLLAEAICLIVGEAIGARIPPGAVYLSDGYSSWLSQRIIGAGEHWEADMRDLISNHDEVGIMLAMDAVMANPDRHRRNILVEPLENEAHLRLWAIDFGDAQVGLPSDYIQLGLELPDCRNHARGLPFQALAPAALEAAERLKDLDTGLLRDAVIEACALVREPLVEELAEALILRCSHADTMVASYLENLEALS